MTGHAVAQRQRPLYLTPHMASRLAGRAGDRVIEGAKRQHDSNKRLFERSLEAGNAGDELHISVSDAMWALSHVRNFSISRHQEQTEMTLLFLALYVGLPW